jgi:hypothetical protein
MKIRRRAALVLSAGLLFVACVVALILGYMASYHHGLHGEL